MENLKTIQQAAETVLAGGKIDYKQALGLWNIEDKFIFSLLAAANLIRQQYKGRELDLCSIINAKSGNCPEDCIFCAQSAHHQAKIKTYNLVSKEKILASARKARQAGAYRFGIVISGRCADTDKETEQIAMAVEAIIADNVLPISDSKALSKNISCCASLGALDNEQADRLKKAGLKRYHHNLETSEGFFPSICTTHTWQERVKTVELAKRKGFEVCSGGIFGLGEKPEERLKLAFSLRDLEIDAVPLNFLHPIPGTPAANLPPLRPLEILKIIALFRFILPDKDIKVGGGREKNLRDLQSLVFMAGANGILIGGYLTTSGRPAELDLQMLRDLELLD